MKKFSIRKYSKSFIALALALVMALGLIGYLGGGNVPVSAKEPTIVKTPAVPLLHPYDKLQENPNYEEDERHYEDGYHSEYRKEFNAIFDKVAATSKTANTDMSHAFYGYLEDTLAGTPYRKIMFYREDGRIVLADKLGAGRVNDVIRDRLPQYAKQYCELWSSARDYYLKTGDYYFEDLLHLYLDIWTVDYQTIGNADGLEGWYGTYSLACGDTRSDDYPMFPIEDVKYGGWYWKPLVWALCYDITTGTGAHKFSPERTCTNAEAITFLWRAVASLPRQTRNPLFVSHQGLATNVGWDLPFENVKLSDYYFFPSKWAYDQGMIPGGTFDTSSVCTRAMIVKYIWQANGSPDVAVNTQFTDVPADADYAKAVAWAVENGITSGTTTTTFSPNKPCTRAQIVTFLYRAYAWDEFKAYEFLDHTPGYEPYIQDGRTPRDFSTGGVMPW